MMPTTPPTPVPAYFRRSGLLPQVEMRRAQQSAACYHTHTHDEFSLGVVDSGTARYRNGRWQDSIHAGCTVLINPGDAHACNPDPGQHWSYRMLFMDAGWVGGLQADIGGGADTGFAPFAARSSRLPQAYAAFHRLFTLLEHNTDPLAADEALLQLLALHGAGQSLHVRQPQLPLQRARALILDQLEETLRLGTIADVAGLSPYHLVRSFKQAYGQTPHAFQLDQRINRGKQLLKRGQTLVSVAHSLGFADQSHFQRHFKHRHAVTPKVYQQALA